MPTKGHNNPPHVVIELDEEMAQFVLDNCEANQRIGIGILENMMKTENRKGAEKIVDMIEKFKKLKSLMEKARAH